MQLDHHVQALQQDLAAVGQLGDEATAEAARRITITLEAALRVRLLDALAEAAGELTTQLGSGRVELRLAGRDPQLVLIDDAAPTAEPAPPGDDALTARLTLRLPEGLKAGIEAAATREGLSVNGWLVRTIARALEPTPSRTVSGRRMTGFARS